MRCTTLRKKKEVVLYQKLADYDGSGIGSGIVGRFIYSAWPVVGVFEKKLGSIAEKKTI